MKHYILNEDGTVSEAADWRAWASWYETANRTICSTEFANCWVSTVFLGLDHNWQGGPPILFETMVFAKEGAAEFDYSGMFMDRYATVDEAKRGHQAICLDVQKLETEAAALSMGLVSKVPVRTAD